MTIGKYIAISGGALLLAVPTVALMILASIDFNNYKPLIQEQIMKSFGRTLSIGGDIELDIGFSSRLAASDISFSNAPWGSRQTMMSIKHAEADVALLPLLFGDIHIDRLILLEPNILLETDDNGKGNWQFEAVDDSENSGTEQDETEQDHSLLQINHVLISNAILNYRDGVSGEQTSFLLDSIEADTKNIDDIFNAQIIGSIDKQPIKLSAQLDDFNRLMTAQSSPMKAEIEYGDLNVNINGELRITSSGYMINALQISLDENLLTGYAYYALSNTNNKPMLEADLRFETLDLRGFPKEKGDTLSKKPSKKASKKASQTSSKGDKLFSSEKIDFSMFSTMNINITIEGEEIIGSNLALNNLTLTAKLTDGLLKIAPLNLNVGGSKLQNTLILDNRGKTAKLKLSSKGRNFRLGEMLRKTDTTDMLIGAPATVNISLRGVGDSPAALAGSLSGRILVDIGKGRVNNRYLNLLGADLTSQLWSVFDSSNAKKEAYTQLECAVINLRPRNGIIKYDKKIAIETDKMNIISSGIIDLKKETLAIGIVPKPRKDAKGLGLGAGSLFSTVQLQGTLTDPKMGVNAANTAKTGAKIYGALVTSGTSLLLEGLINKIVADPHPCQTARDISKSRKKTDTKSMLKKLFGF